MKNRPSIRDARKIRIIQSKYKAKLNLAERDIEMYKDEVEHYVKDCDEIFERYVSMKKSKNRLDIEVDNLNKRINYLEGELNGIKNLPEDDCRRINLRQKDQIAMMYAKNSALIVETRELNNYIVKLRTQMINSGIEEPNIVTP